MAEEPKREEPEEDNALAPGLRPFERWLAGVIGAAGVAAGGVGVFLSDNQAGTTAILVLGAVFLLMGVQGTAIIKAGTDTVQLERRRKALKVIGEAVERVEDKQSHKAAELLKEAKSIDPSLRDDPSFRYLTGQIYEQQLNDAVDRALTRITSDATFGNEIAWAGIQDHLFLDSLEVIIGLTGERQRKVEVRIHPWSTSPPVDDRIRKSVFSLIQMEMPGAIVTDFRMRTAELEALQSLRPDARLEFVTWVDRHDDNSLTESLRKLLTTGLG